MSRRDPKAHDWTPFEKHSLLCLIARNIHVTGTPDDNIQEDILPKRFRKSTRQRRLVAKPKSEAYYDLATVLNKVCHGDGGFSNDIAIEEVSAMVDKVLNDKKAATAFIERQKIGRLTRTMKKSWERGIKFEGSLEEWQDGRRERVLNGKEHLETASHSRADNNSLSPIGQSLMTLVMTFNKFTAASTETQNINLGYLSHDELDEGAQNRGNMWSSDQEASTIRDNNTENRVPIADPFDQINDPWTMNARGSILSSAATKTQENFRTTSKRDHDPWTSSSAPGAHERPFQASSAIVNIAEQDETRPPSMSGSSRTGYGDMIAAFNSASQFFPTSLPAPGTQDRSSHGNTKFSPTALGTVARKSVQGMSSSVMTSWNQSGKVTGHLTNSVANVKGSVVPQVAEPLEDISQAAITSTASDTDPITSDTTIDGMNGLIFTSMITEIPIYKKANLDLSRELGAPDGSPVDTSSSTTPIESRKPSIVDQHINPARLAMLAADEEEKEADDSADDMDMDDIPSKKKKFKGIVKGLTGENALALAFNRMDSSEIDSNGRLTDVEEQRSGKSDVNNS